MVSTPLLRIVSNQVGAPLFSESFLKIPSTKHEVSWFGRSQHDKQNKTINKIKFLKNYILKKKQKALQ